MTIFLARHGQDTENLAGLLNGHRDTELTSLGENQARAAARLICEMTEPIYRSISLVDAIYSSPLRRAFQTARIIAQAVKVRRIITDDLLMERDFGCLTGTSIAAIPSHLNRFPTEGVNYVLDGDGVETFPKLLERASAFIDDVRWNHHGQNVVVVSHGDTGKMLRAAFHGWTWERGLSTPYFANAEVLTLYGEQDILA